MPKTGFPPIRPNMAALPGIIATPWKIRLAELPDQGFCKVFSACARACIYDEHVVSGKAPSRMARRCALSLAISVFVTRKPISSPSAMSV